MTSLLRTSTQSWTPSTTLLASPLLASWQDSRSLYTAKTNADIDSMIGSGFGLADHTQVAADSVNHYSALLLAAMPLTINLSGLDDNATLSLVKASLSDCEIAGAENQEDEWPNDGSPTFPLIDSLDVAPGQTFAEAFQNATGRKISNIGCVLAVSSDEEKEVMEPITPLRDGIAIFVDVFTPPVSSPVPSASQPGPKKGDSNDDSKALIPGIVVCIVLGSAAIVLGVNLYVRPRHSGAGEEQNGEPAIELQNGSGGRGETDRSNGQSANTFNGSVPAGPS